MNEHDFEPVRGLPERLPAGESVLWQGAPDWRVLARRGLHIRGLALYFAASLVSFAAFNFGSDDIARTAVQFAELTGLAAVALGLVAVFAYFAATTTVYTVTNRRVVMRFGIALTMTINLPLSVIEAADQRANPDGSGDVALRLSTDTKVSYLLLWPHARPWRMGRPEPMLRAVPNVAALSAALCRAALPAAMPQRQAVRMPAVQPAHAA